MYTQPLGAILNNVQYMVFVCETQGYTVTKEDWSSSATQLEVCVSETSDWMSAHLLQLNHDKTKFIVFKPHHRVFLLQDCTIHIGDSTITTACHVWNLKFSKNLSNNGKAGLQHH